MEEVIVLGAGNFGTSLAQHLASQGHKVALWTRDSSLAADINQRHINTKYFPSFPLNTNISAATQPTFTTQSPTIVVAIPTQSIRAVLSQYKTLLPPASLIVSAAKGIEKDTLLFPSQLIQEVLGEGFSQQIVSLSGPSFAVEILERQPTCVSIASCSDSSARKAQEIFHSPRFRCYTSGDITGLEVAGALKNVMAVAAGAASGLGFQNNSGAALVTRGLAEMTRLGVFLGANPLTFTGLGGVGDLFLTCNSQKSRNFSVGIKLAKRLSLKNIIESMNSVAEGVTTTKSAHSLAKKHGIDMPIVTEVYKVLYEGKPIAVAVEDLLTREAKPEILLPNHS